LFSPIKVENALKTADRAEELLFVPSDKELTVQTEKKAHPAFL
jgi:hypothetical protein